MTGLLSVAGSTASDSGFELKSVRFNDDDSAYLSRTPTSVGNRKTWTFSCWLKRGNIGVNMDIFHAYTSGDRSQLLIASDDTLKFDFDDSAANRLVTTQVFRDPSAWYHIVVAVDTTQGVAANRVKIYVNGTQVTAFSTTQYPTLNEEGHINEAIQHEISSYDGAGYFIDGYLAEVYFTDGTQLTPSSFGETNEDTNQWQPKNSTDIKPTLTFGTNGFYLPFSNDALINSFTDASAFTPDLTFIPTGALTCDYLIVAGGGGGGNAGANTGSWGAGGGGGAGGVLTSTALALTAQTYTITVGDGGAGGGFQSSAQNGSSGGNSSIVPVTSGTSYIAIGGGAAANAVASSVGLNGGSGGGGCYGTRASGTGTAGPPIQGYDGGTNTYAASGAGGGGAGAQGGASANPAGAGGTGISNDYRDGTSGTTIGTHYFAGGGGAGSYNGISGTATYGGGGGGLVTGTLNGTSNGVAATANSGGGGGGGAPQNVGNPASGGAGGDGGNGIVVVRYVDGAFGSGADMTLISNAQTAQAAPTEGRLMLYEETSTGSTTLDTDLKGYVSRDGGTTYTQTPLTLDTTYETGKTLVSGSVDISGQPSGTSMKYKIETLNQSASKVCRLHGASLLWA
jgi:hypothetical protein